MKCSIDAGLGGGGGGARLEARRASYLYARVRHDRRRRRHYTRGQVLPTARRQRRDSRRSNVVCATRTRRGTIDVLCRYKHSYILKYLTNDRILSKTHVVAATPGRPKTLRAYRRDNPVPIPRSRRAARRRRAAVSPSGRRDYSRAARRRPRPDPPGQSDGRGRDTTNRTARPAARGWRPPGRWHRARGTRCAGVVTAAEASTAARACARRRRTAVAVDGRREVACVVGAACVRACAR